MAERYPDRKITGYSSPGNRKTDESDKSEVPDWRRERELSRSTPEKPDWRKDAERNKQGSGNSPYRPSYSSYPESKMQKTSPSCKTNIYGGAKPVDTRKREEEIDRKLKAQEFQVSKKSGAKGRKLEEELSRSKEAPNYVDKNPYSVLAKHKDN